MTRFSLLVLLLAVSPPLRAQAQGSRLVAAVRELTAGQQVRLETIRAERFRGRFVAVDDSMLALALRDRTARIRLPEIERLWVRSRATGRGALIGAGGGLLVGVAYGLLIGEVACGGDGGDCTPAELALVTGLVGGAGGAVLGAGIGSMAPLWRVRFP